MKTLLLVTFVDFWRKGSGHRTRISSIVNYLKDKVRITVFFAGAKTSYDEDCLKRNFPAVSVEFAGVEAPLTYKEYASKFKDYAKDKFFDFALIEYIELSAVLEYLPDNTITILDTHDLVFDRIRSFKTNNIEYDGIILNKREELDIYRCYDYVILIQKTDYEKIAREMDTSRLLLVPHPVACTKSKIRPRIRNVGYIASGYSPNIDALNWFMNNVWDKLTDVHTLALNIYGNIEYHFLPMPAIRKKCIAFHGFVDNLEQVYRRMDVIINPVRFGAGLKIKNIEALGHGLPLITSTHGASGIEDGSNKAFLTADHSSEYLLAFDRLIENYEFRRRISDEAYKYAQSNFSENQCYGNLMKVINM